MTIAIQFLKYFTSVLCHCSVQRIYCMSKACIDRLKGNDDRNSIFEIFHKCFVPLQCTADIWHVHGHGHAIYPLYTAMAQNTCEIFQKLNCDRHFPSNGQYTPWTCNISAVHCNGTKHL